MKKFIIYIAIFIPFVLFSKELRIDIDGAVFNSFDGNCYWEMYYSFPDSIMNFVARDSNFIGEFKFDVIIKNNLGIIDSVSWIVDYTSKTSVNKGNLLFGARKFQLKSGQYSAKIKISDLNDKTSHAESSFTIFARAFDNNNISISDIELAHLIENEETSAFRNNKNLVKNGLVVVPNPSLEIIHNDPYLNIYFELYNLKKFSPEGYSLKYTVYNSLKEEVFSFVKKHESFSDAVVRTINIPINAMPSGVYFILVKVIPNNEKYSNSNISINKKFYLINPEIPPSLSPQYTENELFAKSEFSTYSEEKLTEEFRKIKYIASSYEKDLFDKLLTQESKQRFLFTFWRKRNTDTNSTYNPEYEKFKERVNFANTYFSYGKMKEGWATDRGRILLKYGIPTQKDYVPVNADYRAYETWFYADIQGGVYFYFVDLTGFGNFSLVHSTAIGELSNYNWYDEYVPIMNTNANQKYIDRNN